jgi:hypothetical protein
MLTESERNIAHRYITLTLARAVLERDLRHLGADVPYKFPELYTDIVTAALDRIGLQLRDIIREMKRQDLRVTDGEKPCEYEMICRGYTDKAFYSAPVLRNYTAEVLREVFGLK